MTNTKSRKPHLKEKRLLKARGWSYRTAAPELKVHFSHLSQVLNGQRESKSLLKRIGAMPVKGAAK